MKYGFTLIGVGIALLIASSSLGAALNMTLSGVFFVIAGITWSFLAAKRHEAMNMNGYNKGPDFPEKSAA